MIYATERKYNSACPAVCAPPSRNALRRAGTAVLVLLGIVIAAAQSPSEWREAPALVTLFGAPAPRAAAYRAYVSTADIDQVLRTLAGDATLARTPGAWEPRPLLPADAFGETGTYDRSAVMRLYGARRPRVARGARLANGRVVESWTLISPYPDAALQRLESGTLLIVLRLP